MIPSLRAWTCAVPEVTPGGSVLELDGVSAAIVPRLADRSIANCVVYRDVAALESSLGELAAAYDDAGVSAWAVWAHESDERAGRVLEDAGHMLDSHPMAMWIDPAAVQRPPDGDLELEPDLDRFVAVVVDAYHMPAFAEAVTSYPPGYRPYLALADGEPAACLAILDVDGDATVTWVGTVERARGRGLASKLMRHALADAAERGCDVSTLQATAMGEPIYARLGYREMGRVNMWERRKPEPAGRAA